MNIKIINLLTNPNANPKSIKTLAESNNISLVKAAVLHPNLPQSIMTKIAKIHNDNVLKNLALNPSLTEEAAYLLLEKGLEETLIKNNNISPYFLEHIYLFGFEDLYSLLAQNENISILLQEKLLSENKWNKELAANPNITDNTLNKLIETNDLKVLNILVDSKRLTSIHIDNILRTQNFIINHFIISMYNSPEIYNIILEQNFMLVEKLLQHKNISLTTVNMLKNSKALNIKHIIEKYEQSIIDRELFIPTNWL